MPKLEQGTRVEVWAGAYNPRAGEPRRGDPWVNAVVHRVDGSRVIVGPQSGAIAATAVMLHHIRMVRRSAS